MAESPNFRPVGGELATLRAWCDERSRSLRSDASDQNMSFDARMRWAGTAQVYENVMEEIDRLAASAPPSQGPEEGEAITRLRELRDACRAAERGDDGWGELFSSQIKAAGAFLATASAPSSVSDGDAPPAPINPGPNPLWRVNRHVGDGVHKIGGSLTPIFRDEAAQWIRDLLARPSAVGVGGEREALLKMHREACAIAELVCGEDIRVSSKDRLAEAIFDRMVGARARADSAPPAAIEGDADADR